MPDNTPEYTSPDLNRYVDSPDMVNGKFYTAFIAGTNSYRSVRFETHHDEDSDNDEIP